MTPITGNTEFIIGIDFGHGETSASFYSLINQEKIDLDILPGQKVIKSAVAILRQEGKETICVGDSAIQKAPMARKFQVSFKKRPSEMTPDERELMVAFMKGVYEGIIDGHPDFKSREHRVFIARPSQDRLWKKEENEYLKIAEDASLPIAGIQKESRAAYFRARTQPDSKIDKHVENGVLIVDYGSSTIDFTYLNKNLEEPIDDGFDLGANAVETALLKHALDNPQDTIMANFKRLYGDSPKSNAYNQMLYKFRVAKEEFYGKKLPNLSVGIDYSLVTSAEETNKQLSGFGGITISKADVRKILENDKYGNYINEVEKAAKNFRDKNLKGFEVECVYLTGGASRMDFVREIFMKVYGLSEDRCPKDDNPSLIVSQGVAHLSYADYKTSEQDGLMKSRAHTIINSFAWDDAIKDSIKSTIKSDIIHKAKCIMIDWKNVNTTIYEVHELDNKCSAPYFAEHPESNKVRNINALSSKFKTQFQSYKNVNFAEECKDVIQNGVIQGVVTELKQAFAAFQFNPEVNQDFSLTGLTAKITENGVETLRDKFTKEGNGHILYDAVAWENGGIMVGWNLEKDRSDYYRVVHFDYYQDHDSAIFDTSTWSTFLKKNITISGIDGAQKQLKAYVDALIDKYISYARLAIFFK